MELSKFYESVAKLITTVYLVCFNFESGYVQG